MKTRLFFAAATLTLSAVTAHAADKLTLQLDWLPGGDKSFSYVGIKEGFYAAEGLDVTIVPGRGSSDALTKVATGNADLATGGLASLFTAAAESPVPVKAVMSIYSRQPDALFVVKGGGITSLKAVVGKTVAMPTFSSSNALWPVVLRDNGIDPASIKTVKVDPSAMAPMLAQGRVDATINWTTVAPGFDAVLRQTGKQLAVLPWSQYGLSGYGLSILASDKLIKDRPDVLKRFLRATARSIQFSVAHPDKAAADLKSIVPEIDATVAAAEFSASIPLIENDITKRDGLGAFDPALLKATWISVARSMNYPLDKVDPEQLVNRSFLAR